MNVAVTSPSDHHLSPEHVDGVLRALGRERSAHERQLGRWLLEGSGLGSIACTGMAVFANMRRVFSGLRGGPRKSGFVRLRRSRICL
jgi:hypothetical protein